MALFGRRLRNTQAEGTQVTLQRLVEHVIYMQDTLERRDAEITRKLQEMEKQIKGAMNDGGQ